MNLSLGAPIKAYVETLSGSAIVSAPGTARDPGCGFDCRLRCADGKFGRLVVRPDSGDPAETCAYTVRVLQMG